MNTPRDLAALEAAAQSWQGTPFCENSHVKGVGVSCHFGVGEIYMEAGWLPRMEIPEGPRDWARSQSRSFIVEWVEASGLFVEVARFERAAPPTRRQLASLLQPGDLLGCRYGQSIHHVAIALRGGRIVQAVEDHGVMIAECVPDVWLKRLERIWRIA